MFDEINEDYYKPAKTKGAFNDNYTEYESRGDKDKKLAVKEYLFMIKPYLRDVIHSHKVSIKLKDPSGKIIDNDSFGEWKIQLTMQINFSSSLDPREILTMDWKSDNVEVLMGNETDDIIKELFESLLKRYQEKLEEKIKDSKFTSECVDLLYYEDSKFASECVDLLYYDLHKRTLRTGKSHKESPEWLINKRASINPQDEDDNSCFQYAITVALNHQNIENHPERISNIEPFINQYNWKDIDLQHTKKTGKYLNKKRGKIIRQLTGKSLNKVI